MLGAALRKIAVGCLAAATAVSAIASLEERAAAGNRLVFCHFMVRARFLVLLLLLLLYSTW